MMPSAATLRTKSHFEILDGLRGVAATAVVLFHCFEVYAHGDRFLQIINHGYLAVDFFFLLSGFVIAYAYDSRWPDASGNANSLTQGEFYRGRLIRLQPMVILGNLIGAALFYFQRAPIYPMIAMTPIWKLLLVTLVGCAAIPLLPSMDVRGFSEMYPLNGPVWSLFYEYVANFFYAVGLRKLSRKALAGLVITFAVLLLHYTIFGSQGDVIGGWAIGRIQVRIGFTRLLYPFFAGVLLMRLGKRIKWRGAFATCSLILIVCLSIPRLGGAQHLWLNGLYESICILVVFPFIVAIGAGSKVTSPAIARSCRFLGDISYPLYITHYPWIYLYTAWVTRYRIPLGYGAVMSVALLFFTVCIAYACLKLYDEPVRAWLVRRYLRQPAKVLARPERKAA